MVPDAGEPRPALYYPYIHIRSERWLKATLLCMPTVKRIIPHNCMPEDEPAIAAYEKIAGPYGQLLQTVPASTPAANQAQHRLLDELKANSRAIKNKYGRNRAPATDRYWIHTAKFTDVLLDYLRRNDLAWPSSAAHAVGHRSWCFALCIHST